MNLNKAILIGRLTRDPESRSLPSGQQVTSFGLATDRFFTDKTGQKQQQTEFHNIVMFGKLANIASQYLKKGSLTLVEGRLQTRSWQDAAGNKRYRTEIVAERLQLGPKSATTSRLAGEAEKTTPPGDVAQEEIPVVEEEEINVKDIPF